MKSDLTKIRSALSKGPNRIFLHSNADMDCVGSAAVLALHYGNSKICSPGGVSHLGKRLLDILEMEVADELNSAEEEYIFVVDAQTDSSLGYTGVNWGKALVIDHHKNTGCCKAAGNFIDEEATSCCELVWEVIGRPKHLDKKIGLSLMAGIIADTGHLKRGTHATLATASEILEASGLDLEEVQVTFESAEDQDMSRRISRLKGAQRMKFDRVGEWIVAATEIGAFESAACHALLATGADVAFAGSQKEDEFRITGRANWMATGAGIHLGDMFNKIASECGGEGGGHDGAAGFSGKGDIEAMLDICVQTSLAQLKGNIRSKSSE
jgi:phosphoesterase RecJ-like protein